jgi:hypothetical protein
MKVTVIHAVVRSVTFAHTVPFQPSESPSATPRWLSQMVTDGVTRPSARVAPVVLRNHTLVPAPVVMTDRLVQLGDTQVVGVVEADVLAVDGAPVGLLLDQDAGHAGNDGAEAAHDLDEAGVGGVDLDRGPDQEGRARRRGLEPTFGYGRTRPSDGTRSSGRSRMPLC